MGCEHKQGKEIPINNRILILSRMPRRPCWQVADPNAAMIGLPFGPEWDRDLRYPGYSHPQSS